MGIVPEPPATLSSAPYIAMLFYFRILKPQGPAPKLCAQNAFPSILQLQMPVPNRGSQASQDTAGRNLLNRTRDLTQTSCLIRLLLSVSIPTTGSQQLREHTSLTNELLKDRLSWEDPGHLLDTNSQNVWLIVPNYKVGIQSYQVGMVLKNEHVVLLQHAASKAKCNLLLILASVSLLMKQEQLIRAWQ